MRLGWLSPRGDFISCGKYEHFEIAQNICVKKGTHLTQAQADEKLLNAGWMRITLSSLPPIEYYICYRRLSDEQKNWLRREIETHERDDFPVNELILSKLIRELTTL